MRNIQTGEDSPKRESVPVVWDRLPIVVFECDGSIVSTKNPTTRVAVDATNM
jgi:hypothetical protein